MGWAHFRYHEPSLDSSCAMQHDAYVSSIFLQENRFSPPPGGYFFARFSPVSRPRRPVSSIRFGTTGTGLAQPSGERLRSARPNRSFTQHRAPAVGLSTIFRSRPVRTAHRLVLPTDSNPALVGCCIRACAFFHDSHCLRSRDVSLKIPRLQ